MGTITKKGEREGHGTQCWKDGHVYTGEFKHDQREGKGRMTSANGTYDGHWEANCRHGKGCITWPNCIKYDGEWSHDRINGTGRYDWADGNSYEG